MKLKNVSVIILFVILVCILGCSKNNNQVDISTEEVKESTSVEETTVEDTTEGPTEPIVIRAKEIALSGDASEVIAIEEPSYIVSDRFIIYADAGVELNGDAEGFISSVMASLEEVSGMTYDNDIFNPQDREKAVTEELEEGYNEASNYLSDATCFYGVDLEQAKMCIFVVPDAKDASFYNNGVVLRQADLKPEGRRQAVTELAGMLCLRVGNVSLGDSIDGGMAGYLTQLFVNNYTEYGIGFDGFLHYNGVERFAVTEKNASNMICTSHGFEADSIGFRFIIFLNEAYNADVIKSVYNSCASYRGLFMGTNSGTVTMQKVVDLIKKATSANVFTEFYEWYKVNAVRFGDTSYIEAETATDTQDSTEETTEGESASTDGNTEQVTKPDVDWESYFDNLFWK